MFSIHPIPFVTHPDKNYSHYSFFVDAVSYAHSLFTQLVPLIHQHYFVLFKPLNFEQSVVLLPGYDVHGSVWSMHPNPFDTHVLKNNVHYSFVVAVMLSPHFKCLHGPVVPVS